MAKQQQPIAHADPLTRGDVIVAMQDHGRISAGGYFVVCRILRSRDKKGDGVQILGDMEELYPLGIFRGLFRPMSTNPADARVFADVDGSLHKCLLEVHEGLTPVLAIGLQRTLVAATELLFPPTKQATEKKPE